jgi:hypothetical protein
MEATQPYVQLCTSGDVTGKECLRLAFYTWQPDPEDDPLFLCRFHADLLLTPGQSSPPKSPRAAGP